ncbi:hypothetical protein CASFOL_027977 [Castilleja foliolosa]|uniref:Pectate lyase n=1 Tax=Castilleja foliolosa TaxID=1961234 RepID=A0ABD3CJ07_9LAMI
MLMTISMAMPLLISFCYLAIFLISSSSFVASTRTLQNRRNLGYSEYNDMDNCWMSHDWENNRKRLADCAIGWAMGTTGGKEGKYYEVTSNDDNPTNPMPGTLRHAVTRLEPLWIIFRCDHMEFNLKEELIITSNKTLDGRGCVVNFKGPACLVVQSVQNVIIHGIHIHNCGPTGGDGVEVMSSEDHTGFRGRTEGDAVSLWDAQYIWVDHNDLSNSSDGLIDAVEGSSYITISNNRLSHHNEAMLLGHNDTYVEDKGMRVTILYNNFGPGLTQRIPRVRFGGVEVVNNFYQPWSMYAIGGSANATIVSKGNIYLASNDSHLKEVTKHLYEPEEIWMKGSNWISDGDLMVNGAFFSASGSKYIDDGVYKRASTVEAKDRYDVPSLVQNAGPWKCGTNLNCWDNN